MAFCCGVILYGGADWRMKRVLVVEVYCQYIHLKLIPFFLDIGTV
jgi:hypothetical protein